MKKNKIKNEVTLAMLYEVEAHGSDSLSVRVLQQTKPLLGNELAQSKNFFSALLHAEEIEPHFQYSLSSESSTFMEIYYFDFQLARMSIQHFCILSQQNS